MRLVIWPGALIFLLTAITFLCSGVGGPHADAETSFSGAHKDVAYVRGGGTDQSLDIYMPSTPGPHPVVVYVHGGAWVIGDKKLKPRETRAYTDRGYFLVSVNYRLAPTHTYPSNLQDIHRATNWIHNNIADYGGDPTNMVLVGHSAGAHLVTLAGVGSDSVNYRPAAMRFKTIFSVDTASYDLTRKSRDRKDRVVTRAAAKTFGNNPATRRSASPIHQIDADIKYNPIHLFVTRKRQDALAETDRMARALGEAKQPVRVSKISGASHKKMNQLIFQQGSEVFEAICAALQ